MFTPCKMSARASFAITLVTLIPAAAQWFRGRSPLRLTRSRLPVRRKMLLLALFLIWHLNSWKTRMSGSQRRQRSSLLGYYYGRYLAIPGEPSWDHIPTCSRFRSYSRLSMMGSGPIYKGYRKQGALLSKTRARLMKTYLHWYSAVGSNRRVIDQLYQASLITSSTK